MRAAQAVAAALLAAVLLLEGAADGARKFAPGSADSDLKRPVEHHHKGGKVEHMYVPLDHASRLAFDPQYANDLELDHEELGIEPSPHHDATVAALRERLRELLPTIDSDHDGRITLDELWTHHLKNGMDIIKRRLHQDFLDLDANQDGRLTLKEYLNDRVGGHKSEEELTIHELPSPNAIDYESWVETTRASFLFCDEDEDGALNEQEFFHFTHPEESDNQGLKYHVMAQEVHSRDDNKDGRLDEVEFRNGMWSSFHLWEPEGEYSEEKERESAHLRFISLDKNADGYLTTSELMPAFTNLRPTEARYARLQAEHMLEMADDDKDGYLTLEEMLNNPYVFYSSVHDLPEQHDEF